MKKMQSAIGLAMAVTVATTVLTAPVAKADEEKKVDPKATIFKKALQAHQSKHYAQAIQYYSQYITLDPANPYMYYNRGVVYLHTGNCQSALKDFQQVIGLKPSFKMAYYESAICYGDYLHDYKNALVYFDKTLKIDPKYILALRNKAVTLFKLEQYNQSIDVFNQILDVSTMYKQSYIAIAVNYYRLKQYDMVKLYVTKAIKAGIPQNQIPQQIMAIAK